MLDADVNPGSYSMNYEPPCLYIIIVETKNKSQAA